MFPDCYFVPHFTADSRTSGSHFLWKTYKLHAERVLYKRDVAPRNRHWGIVHHSYPKYLILLAVKHFANSMHITHKSSAHRHRICMPCIYKGGPSMVAVFYCWQ